jgi:hypothetical protein
VFRSVPHVIERAPTGRSGCRACGSKIAAGLLRLGERVPNPFAAGEAAETTHWYHLECAAYRRPEAWIEAIATTAEMIENREALSVEAAAGVAHHRLPRAGQVERSPTGRATCRHCRALIEKGVWRIALVYYEEGRFAPAGYVHLTCAASYFETDQILPRLKYFSAGVSDDDLAEIEATLQRK